MLCIQDVTYTHPDKTILFKNISLSVKKQDKVSLIGNNGSGKSTLLKIAAGILKPSQGNVQYQSPPYYIPQHFGQFNDLTIGMALHIDSKIKALHEIVQGNISESNWALLNEDWTIEERCFDALAFWNLNGIPLTQSLNSLSGGEKTKVFLAGILIHKPEIVLLDEPTNHLDICSRNMLYRYIQTSDSTLVIVSHDRALLEHLDITCELGKHSITVYGGNFTFYKEQKCIEENALVQHFENRERALKAAKRVEREAIERKQRQNARGKGKIEKENMPRIMKKTMKNSAEASTAKLMKTHSVKINSISDELKHLGERLPDIAKIKLDFDNSSLHSGKILVKAQDINFKYCDHFVWKNNLTFHITSGDRICIKGYNGAGKSTLIRIILGEIKPDCGVFNGSEFKSIYIDQDYSLIKNDRTVYEQVQDYNQNGLEEHEVKIRLNRFLFDKDFWERKCSTLSGGEKMRLMLCCLMICDHAPDLFVLDEPTNNLDIQNIEILASAINGYTGTLIIVSHDQHFLNEINVNRDIEV